MCVYVWITVFGFNNKKTLTSRWNKNRIRTKVAFHHRTHTMTPRNTNINCRIQISIPNAHTHACASTQSDDCAIAIRTESRIPAMLFLFKVFHLEFEEFARAYLYLCKYDKNSNRIEIENRVLQFVCVCIHAIQIKWGTCRDSTHRMCRMSNLKIDIQRFGFRFHRNCDNHLFI